MRRFPIAAVPMALLAAALLVSAPGVDEGQDDDPPTPPIKELMGILNKGPEALTPTIGRGLDKNQPDWVVLTEQAERYVTNVKDLGKNVPPRGEPASWERLTKNYLKNAKALGKAIAAHDRKAALAAHEKIEQSCARCHVKHKP